MSSGMTTVCQQAHLDAVFEAVNSNRDDDKFDVQLVVGEPVAQPEPEDRNNHGNRSHDDACHIVQRLAPRLDFWNQADDLLTMSLKDFCPVKVQAIMLSPMKTTFLQAFTSQSFARASVQC